MIPGGLADRILDDCRKASVRSAPVTGDLLWREPSPRRIFYRCLRRGKGFAVYLEDITPRKKAEEEACMNERNAGLTLEGILGPLPVGRSLIRKRVTMINGSLRCWLTASKISGRPRGCAGVCTPDEIFRSRLWNQPPRFGVELNHLPETMGLARTWISHYIPGRTTRGGGWSRGRPEEHGAQGAPDALRTPRSATVLHDTMNWGRGVDQAHLVAGTGCREDHCLTWEKCGIEPSGGPFPVPNSISEGPYGKIISPEPHSTRSEIGPYDSAIQADNNGGSDNIPGRHPEAEAGRYTAPSHPIRDAYRQKRPTKG